MFKAITDCSSNTSFLQNESVGMCFAGYGDRGDMIIQEDTVFVSGMSPALTEEDIQQHFGAIGVIKVSTPYILSSVLWVLGVKQPSHEADHSSPSSAKVKNEWSYNAASLICLYGMPRAALLYVSV